MPDPNLNSIVPWAPHPDAAPLCTRKDANALVVAANGTRTCVGGWQLSYSGVRPGQHYAIRLDVQYEGLDDARDGLNNARDGLNNARDALECRVFWGEKTPEEAWNKVPGWDYLLPEADDEGRMRFSRIVRAPQDASALVIRTAFRWATPAELDALPMSVAVSKARSMLIARTPPCGNPDRLHAPTECGDRDPGHMLRLAPATPPG